MRNFGTLLAGSALALVAVSSAAVAGGFQRGTADTDILYESGTVSSRFGFTYVNPNRGFSSINGVDGDYGDYTGNYKIPSGAVALGNDMVGCAATVTESFAAEADYSSPLPRQNSSTLGTSNTERMRIFGVGSTSQTVGTEFNSNEFGATCRISYSTENSRFSLLGGLFFEDFDFAGESIGERNANPIFQQTAQGRQLVTALRGGQITLPSVVEVESSSGFELGYRIGAAYEIPEIALRAQIMYRSEVEHEDIRGAGSVTITDTAFVTLANGTTTSVPTAFATTVNGSLAAGGFAPGSVFAVDSFLSDSTSPQSITINAQTGIAPGTLLLASFRWTDWSTNDAVVSTISSPVIGVSSSYAPYNWDDGYTASLGIGKAFNETISGAISIGYDSGVSTGAETTYTDLYTLSGGVSFKPETWGEIRIGGLVGYWTDGEQSVNDGAFFNATVDDTIVLAGTASIKLTF